MHANLFENQVRGLHERLAEIMAAQYESEEIKRHSEELSNGDDNGQAQAHPARERLRQVNARLRANRAFTRKKWSLSA